ncbi:MAG TPA: TlpA disulfide reductase family protein [Parasegetibacter sp.]
MKKIFLLAVGAFPLMALAQDKPNFTIEGSLKNFKNPVSMVYLNYATDGKRLADSANVVDGKYSFKGTLSEAVKAQLAVKYADGTPRNNRRDVAQIYIEPGKITLASVDSFSNVKVTGSKSNADNDKLNAQLKSLNDKMNELNARFAKARADKDDAAVASIRKEGMKLQEEIRQENKKFIAANPKSPIVISVLSSYAGYNIDIDDVEPLFAKISPELKNTPSGKAFAEKLNIARKTAIGQPAMDFTQNDPNGKPVSLSSFKGKYVLVDFWASWCGPCRAENPHVVKAYNKYKDKGFDILGVSLDNPDGKDKWLKAIEDDKLTWTQVSDLQGWNNAASKKYGVSAIPMNLLIDPNGIIVAKNLRGAALEQKLAELLD